MYTVHNAGYISISSNLNLFSALRLDTRVFSLMQIYLPKPWKCRGCRLSHFLSFFIAFPSIVYLSYLWVRTVYEGTRLADFPYSFLFLHHSLVIPLQRTEAGSIYCAQPISFYIQKEKIIQSPKYKNSNKRQEDP